MSNIKPYRKIAVDLDSYDELPIAKEFYFPEDELGSKTYLCGHSLGLAPVNAGLYLQEQLLNWQKLGVEGHFNGETPWIHYLQDIESKMAMIVGAQPQEVTIMNALTANIHFLLSGFYRPTPQKYRVVMEANAFASDHYAIASHLRVRGIPDDAIIYWHPDRETGFFKLEDLKSIVEKHQDELALIFIGGLNYLNGQLFDLAGITSIGHEYDLTVGLDLAHAAGNVPLLLHEWEVDFACWCTYKYLNGGPGSLGGCFIHQKHHDLEDHFQGWWGNSLENRFEMVKEFTAATGAAGWQLSNPPIMALPPLKASLELFDRFGMDQLRRKSILLTGYLENSLAGISLRNFELKTPINPVERGAMLCIRLKDNGMEIFKSVLDARIITDFRNPDTIRVAPHPLYNSFEDCHRFAKVFEQALKQ